MQAAINAPVLALILIPSTNWLIGRARILKLKIRLFILTSRHDVTYFIRGCARKMISFCLCEFFKMLISKIIYFLFLNDDVTSRRHITL